MQISTRYDPFPVKQSFHGIYAHGVETLAQARHLFVSGQVGMSPDGELAAGFEAQCEQAIDNLLSVLKSANMQATNIVKMTFFLTRRQDMDSLVRIRKAKLDGVRPAITTVFVAGLVEQDWLVEVEVIAASYSANKHGYVVEGGRGEA